MAQMGAYDRLLDYYYEQEAPLPADIDACCRIAGAMSKQDRADVAAVLARFFVLTDAGYRQDRAEEELVIGRRKIEAAQANGKRGGRPVGSVKKPNGLPDGLPAGTQDEPGAKAPHHQEAFATQKTSINSSLRSELSGPALRTEPAPTPAEGDQNGLWGRSEVSSATHVPGAPEKTRQQAISGLGGPTFVASPPPFDGSNAEVLNGRHIVQLSPAFELPAEWGLDAEALGFPRQIVIREAEKYRQYWTAGGGMGKRKTVRGWRQSWSNWLGKAAKDL